MVFHFHGRAALLVRDTGHTLHQPLRVDRLGILPPLPVGGVNQCGTQHTDHQAPRTLAGKSSHESVNRGMPHRTGQQVPRFPWLQIQLHQ